MTEGQIQNAMLRWLIPKCEVVMMNHHFRTFNESDVFALYKTGYLYNFEIKISVSDFKADFKKAIHRVYLKDADRFRSAQPFNRWAFVVPEEIAAKAELLVPEYAGLYVIKPHRLYFGEYEIKAIKPPPMLHKNKLSDDDLNRVRASMVWKYYRSIGRVAELERKLEEAREKS